MREAIQHIEMKVQNKLEEIKTLNMVYDQAGEQGDTATMEDLGKEISYLEIEMYALLETKTELEEMTN